MPEGQALARETYLKAISVAENSRKDRPKDAGLLAILGSFYAAVGDAEKSLPSLRQAAALAPNDSNILYRVSEGYELLHRRDDALRWIARAVDAGLSFKTIESNPELAQLRADPRFLAISKRLR
jgi:tetratricopeptide (TPR) repeat protein